LKLFPDIVLLYHYVINRLYPHTDFLVWIASCL